MSAMRSEISYPTTMAVMNSRPVTSVQFGDGESSGNNRDAGVVDSLAVHIVIAQGVAGSTIIRAAGRGVGRPAGGENVTFPAGKNSSSMLIKVLGAGSV
jgi:hypothetical protein